MNLLWDFVLKEATKSSTGKFTTSCGSVLLFFFASLSLSSKSQIIWRVVIIFHSAAAVLLAHEFNSRSVVHVKERICARICAT